MTEITESAEIWASCFIDKNTTGVSRYYSRIKPPCFAESQESFSSLLYALLKERRDAGTGQLYWFAVADATKHYQWGGLNNRNVSSHSSGV